MSHDLNPYASPAATGEDDAPEILGDAQLVHSGTLLRRIRLATEEEIVIEYSGRGMGYDTVRVNDRTAAWNWKWVWFVPRFDFTVTINGRRRPAVLSVEIGSSLQLRRLVIEVDDRVVYDERT